ncbi:MAG: hypothetical protein ACR2PB_01080 [Desulfocapsaceae bacterium]
MKITLEYDCMNEEFREGDEITIDPTLGIGGDDHVLIMYDDGKIDIGRVRISPQSEVPLLETGDGKMHLSTDVDIAGKVIKLERDY